MVSSSIEKATLYIFGIFLLIQNQVLCASWTVRWEHKNNGCENSINGVCPLELHMSEAAVVNVTISNLDFNGSTNRTIQLVCDSEVLDVPIEIPVHKIADKIWRGSFIADATFIGKANVRVVIDQDAKNEQSDSSLPVIIVRAQRVIDTVFVVSVATLVSILYINFGAAMDLKKVRGVLRRPVGPIIAFGCHFLLLPLASYALGLLLFPNNPALRLGLFFTGSSPAGGASNTWTVIFNGNIDLSITMSTTSTLASFVMTPVWIFTLGKVIFDSANLRVPYTQIGESVFALIFPLAIGFLIQRYFPRIGRFLVRILKPASSLLIIFIVVFAIVTNLYLFKLFTWQILIAGLLLPWTGYFVAWLLSILLKQNYEDRLAIAIEAGIQNTGIAIFVLRYALPQPEADLTTVMPVSVAIFTPFPLIAFYICLTCREWIQKRRSRQFPAEIKECIQSQESSGVY